MRYARLEAVGGLRKHLRMTAILGSGLALVGTFIQFSLSIRQLEGFERETFRTIDDWRREVSWRHPFRRRRHRSEIARVLAASPDEAAVYARVGRLLFSWTLLTVAATLFLIQAITTAITG